MEERGNGIGGPAPDGSEGTCVTQSCETNSAIWRVISQGQLAHRHR
jgi:hypothetical protein